MRSATAQLSAGSPFAVVSQQRALGDQYEEANAQTWTSGITGSGYAWCQAAGPCCFVDCVSTQRVKHPEGMDRVCTML